MTAVEERNINFVDTPGIYESSIKLPVSKIRVNPNNPRKDATADEAMVESIRQLGLIEPVIVRPVDEDDAGTTFELLAGHRRLDGVTRAGFGRVNAHVRHCDDAGTLEIALVENLARKNLSPLEEAAAMAGLVDLKKSQRDIAKLLGVSQPHVSKRLALLKLPETAREAVDSGVITLDQAIDLTKLDAKTVTGLFKKGPPRHWDIESAVRNQQHKEDRAAAIKELRDAGVEVLPDAPGWNAAHPPCRVASIGLNPEEHRSEACRAVFVDNYGHRTECCTNPDNHPEVKAREIQVREVDAGTRLVGGTPQTWVPGQGYVDDTALTDEHRQAVTDHKAREAESEQRKADRERRREFARTLVAKPPPASRIAHVVALAAWVLPTLSDYGVSGVVDLLGLGSEFDDNNQWRPWEEMLAVLQGWLAGDPHRQEQLVYAMALDAANDLMGWQDDSYEPEVERPVRAYLQHLADVGYDLSPLEQATLTPTTEDTALEGPVGDVATPEATVTRSGKSWKVSCSACGVVAAKQTSESYAIERRIVHLQQSHGIAP